MKFKGFRGCCQCVKSIDALSREQLVLLVSRLGLQVCRGFMGLGFCGFLMEGFWGSCQVCTVARAAGATGQQAGAAGVSWFYKSGFLGFWNGRVLGGC